MEMEIWKQCCRYRDPPPSCMELRYHHQRNPAVGSDRIYCLVELGLEHNQGPVSPIHHGVVYLLINEWKGAKHMHRIIQFSIIPILAIFLIAGGDRAITPDSFSEGESVAEAAVPSGGDWPEPHGIPSGWPENGQKLQCIVTARLNRIEALNRQNAASGVARRDVAEVLEEEGVPAEAAFDEEVLTGEVSLVEIEIGTGQKKGVYYAACAGNNNVSGFANLAEGVLDTTCTPTGGSNYNLQRLNKGTLGAGMAQSDAMDQFLRKNKQADFDFWQKPMYQEPLFLIVNKDGDIDNVTDLDEDDHLLILGPKQSGPHQSWLNMTHHVKEGSKGLFGGRDPYSGIKTDNMPTAPEHAQ